MGHGQGKGTWQVPVLCPRGALPLAARQRSPLLAPLPQTAPGPAASHSCRAAHLRAPPRMCHPLIPRNHSAPPCRSMFYKHSVYVAGEMYSAPSIVLQARRERAASWLGVWENACRATLHAPACGPPPMSPGTCPALLLLAAPQLPACALRTWCIPAAAHRAAPPALPAPPSAKQSRRADGGVKVFDDFREAYAWLSHNTGAWVGRYI